MSENVEELQIEATLKQRRKKVASTLFQRRTLTLFQLCATLKIQRWTLFIFTLDQLYFNVDPQH